MTLDELNAAVLIGAAVVLLAVAAVRLAVGTGMPSLLIYLALGVIVGNSQLGVRLQDYELTGALGYAALALILAEGGLSTRWNHIRPVVAPAAALATVGTAISIVVTGAAVHWLLDVGWAYGFLVGAVLSSTDAAAVFSVLRRVPLPRRLTALLEAESGFNDAPVVIAVVVITGAMTGQATGPWWWYLLIAAAELAGGALVGVVIGYVGGLRLRAIALPSSGLYPIAVMALCLLAYGAASVANASGFLAVYVAALVLGNSRLPHRAAVRGFAEGLGWLGQIGLFVLLGLVVNLQALDDVLAPSLVTGLALLLVARPLSVFLTLLPFPTTWRQQVFLSWAGLRGAVPIVLATIPVAARAPGAQNLFELVFLLVVVFTLVQAPALPAVARWLKVQGDGAQDVELESSPLGRIGAEVLHVSIGRDSRLGGVALFELRLPVGANVTLIVRGDKTLVPEPRTVLRHGDELLLVVPESVRDRTEERLRAVSRSGRLADWRDGGMPGGQI